MINDGTVNSNTLSREINVTAVNNSPVLANLETKGVSYKEGDPATQITNTITVTDIDNTNMDSAVVSITANYKNGEDVLSYTKIGNIAGVFDASSGKMVLSGNDSKANYQSALRSVNYLNTSSNPSTSARTVSFYVNDGTVNSNTLSRNINVIAVNNSPVLSKIETTTLNYTEGSGSQKITDSLKITDVDNTTFASAAVSITGNYSSGEDVLSFSNTSSAVYGNISSSYNTSNGVLTLTSSGVTATLAQWQSALRSVQYKNTSSNPSVSIRTVSFVINDGSANSNTKSRNINVIAVNNPPVLANIETKPLKFTEGDAALQLTSTLNVSDVDNTNFDSAAVIINSNYTQGEDILVYAKVGNIKGTFNSSKGEILLTGLDTKANYQLALSSVKYLNTSQNPSISPRTVSFYVNDGASNSDTVKRNINIIAVNDAPVLSQIEKAGLQYTEGGPAVNVSGTISVSDVDNTNMKSAVVGITSNYNKGEDILTYNPVGNITGAFNSVNRYNAADR